MIRSTSTNNVNVATDSSFFPAEQNSSLIVRTYTQYTCTQTQVLPVDTTAKTTTMSLMGHTQTHLYLLFLDNFHNIA